MVHVTQKGREPSLVILKAQKLNFPRSNAGWATLKITKKIATMEEAGQGIELECCIFLHQVYTLRKKSG